MGINARALPAHVRRLIPGSREPRKRRIGQSGKPAILRDAGVDSEPELILANRLERAGLPLGEPQYRFVPGRQYRFDRAYPDQKVAIEVQGGIWIDGAHSRGSGVSRDCVKYSIAAALGWRVLPVTVEMIEDGTAVDLIRRALACR